MNDDTTIDLDKFNTYYKNKLDEDANLLDEDINLLESLQNLYNVSTNTNLFTTFYN